MAAATPRFPTRRPSGSASPPTGGLRLHQGATDIGQGSNTVITQICADALGMPLADFELVGPDTALTPDCGKTSASRQTFITGKAAELSGRRLRADILRLSNMTEEAVIRLDGAAITISDGAATRRIELADMPADELGYVLRAEESFDPPTVPLDENGQGTPYAVYGYGAQVAEIEVDLRLGTVKVIHITAAHDLGRVINPILATGQIEGGIAQGLGMALMEEYIPGRTENLHDYLIPSAGDMPTVDTIFIEKPDPDRADGGEGAWRACADPDGTRHSERHPRCLRCRDRPATGAAPPCARRHQAGDGSEQAMSARATRKSAAMPAR